MSKAEAVMEANRLYARMLRVDYPEDMGDDYAEIYAVDSYLAGLLTCAKKGKALPHNPAQCQKEILSWQATYVAEDAQRYFTLLTRVQDFLIQYSKEQNNGA